MVKWSRESNVLCIGTEKGTLVFYNKKGQRKIPCVGKHSKKVLYGDWNGSGEILTGAEDKMLVVSNTTGDAVGQTTFIKGAPTDIKWLPKKQGEEEQRFGAMVINNTSVNIVHPETQQITEVSFAKNYGKVVTFCIAGEGYLVMAFNNGITSVVSTMPGQVG